MERYTETLSELIRIRTSADRPEEFAKTIHFIEDFFSHSGIKIKRFEFNGIPSIYISAYDSLRPDILLQGHLDVVEGRDEQFIPKVINHKLYGRGSVDMKGFDTVAMHLLRDLAEEHPQLKVGLVLTFDEEIGGENGAKKLVEAGLIPKILINGDGGNNFTVTTAQKGIAKIKFSVKSQPSPHPYPWEGENAFDCLVKDYCAIQKLFIDHHKATQQDNWYTTYSAHDVQVKNGGILPPDYAEMIVNFYYTENITPSEFEQNIREKTHYSTLALMTESQPLIIDRSFPHIERFRKIMEDTFDHPIDYRTENGGSDAKFYANSKIPIIIFKMVGEGHHTDSEYLDIRYFEAAYQALKTFIITELAG